MITKNKTSTVPACKTKIYFPCIPDHKAHKAAVGSTTACLLVFIFHSVGLSGSASAVHHALHSVSQVVTHSVNGRMKNTIKMNIKYQAGEPLSPTTTYTLKIRHHVNLV